jgi:hypothetical protein
MYQPPTLESLIAEVDPIQAQFSHVRNILDQITEYDVVVGGDLTEAFDMLISRLAYHVNHSITHAYDTGRAEAIEQEISRILDEENFTKIEFTCVLKDEYGFTTAACFIDPTNVAEVYPGGKIDFQETKGVPYSKMKLKTGTRLLVLGDVEDIGDFINFLINPGINDEDGPLDDEDFDAA